MKRGDLYVIGFTFLIVAVGLSYTLWLRRFESQRRALWDVYAALVYYMEDHKCFPESADSLLACSFVTVNQDGAVTIQERQESSYAPYTYGAPIADLADVGVRWGEDLSMLRIQGPDTVVDEAGHPVLLVDRLSLHPNDAYTYALMTAYEAITEP